MVLQSDVDNGIDCVGFPYIRCGTGAYPRRIGMSTTGGFEMHTFAAAGAGFLLAVLWFDLMFDVQTRKHTGEVLPPEVLTSISAYYRRVTTEAYPMNRLVALVMLLRLLPPFVPRSSWANIRGGSAGARCYWRAAVSCLP